VREGLDLGARGWLPAARVLYEGACMLMRIMGDLRKCCVGVDESDQFSLFI
jgi:hypothetical protein